MTRIIAGLFLIVISVSVSGEELRGRLSGTWRGKAHDGSVNTLVIGERSISWKCETPNKGTSTLSVPSYEINDDGVLFGYAREFAFSNNRSEIKNNDLIPFACKIDFDLDGESLTVSGLRIHQFETKGQLSFCATYKKPKVEESIELASPTVNTSTR